MSEEQVLPDIKKKFGHVPARFLKCYSHEFGFLKSHRGDGDDLRIYLDLEDTREGYEQHEELEAHLGIWTPDGFRVEKTKKSGVKDHLDLYLSLEQLRKLHSALGKMLFRFRELEKEPEGEMQTSDSPGASERPSGSSKPSPADFSPDQISPSEKPERRIRNER